MKSRIALLICALMLVSAILSFNASAGDPEFELTVEQTSNLFPTAISGYEDLSKLADSENEVLINAVYKFCAPQYMITELEFEISFDEDALEFYPSEDATGTPTSIIPVIFPYGADVDFDDSAEPDGPGRTKMTLSYSGNANASYPDGRAINLINVPFLLSDYEELSVSSVNIDLYVNTLTLSRITDNAPEASSVDMVESSGNTVKVVENGIVDADALALIKMTSTLSPKGVDLIELSDIKAAEKVSDMIKALPLPANVRKSDSDAIKAARSAYDALTSAQKSKIDPATLKKLTDCEAALKALENASKLVVKGASNFCPDVEAKTVEAGDNIDVYFVAPVDMDITYMFWSMSCDEDFLKVTGVNSIKGGNIEIGSSTAHQTIEIPDSPYHIKKGDILISFAFEAKAAGETTVELFVTTEKGANTHKVTIDMGGHGENVVYEAEDGEKAYDVLFDKHHFMIGAFENGYEMVNVLRKPLSEVTSPDEYFHNDLRNILNFEVHEDVTLYAIWLEFISEIEIEVAPPAAGERSLDIKYEKINGYTYFQRTNPEDAHYSYYQGIWYTEYSIGDDGIYYAYVSNDPYVAGRDYYSRIHIVPDVGYMFSSKIKVNFTGEVDNELLSQGVLIDHSPERYCEHFVDVKVRCPLNGQSVSDTISAMPEISALKAEYKDTIKSAKAAYDALTEDQKKLVSKEAADKLIASDVVVDVLSLPDSDTITKDDKAAVKAAKKAYDELTDEQKKLVPKEVADKLIASDVIVDVLSLPDADTITKDDKSAVEAARKAYNALTEDQKKLVPKDVLERLAAAEEAVKKDSGSFPVVVIIIAAVCVVAAVVVIVVLKKKKTSQRKGDAE